MATISSLSGQSSIYSIINSLTTIARQPIITLETKRTRLDTLNAAYADLKTKLSALNSVAEGMIDPLDSSLEARMAASGDSDVVTATATSSAALGSHSIFVSQLAKHHTMVSDQFTRADSGIRTQEGTGDKTFSVTVNGVTTNVTVTIDADDTDEDIINATAAAINSAMADVDDGIAATALVDTSTTMKLVLRGDETGTTYKMDLADVTGTLLSTLGIDDESQLATGTTGGYIYADSDLTAELTVDGVAISRDSNVLDDVVNGLTITLRSSQDAGADAVDLTVSPAASSIRSTVEGLLEKYNDSLAYLRSKTAVTQDGTRSALSGEYVYRSLIGNLRSAAAGMFSTGSDDIETLYNIGITADATGKLAISDSDAFEEALESAPQAVASLFNGTNGLAAQIEDILDPFVNAGGYIDNNTTNVSSKITAINESIERLEDRVERRELQLIAQYSSLQESLALLSSQQNYLASFLQM